VRAGQSAPVDGRVGRATWHAWVVSPRHDSGSKKGVCTLEPPAGGRVTDHAGDRTVTLAMPNKAPSTEMWKRCGRRERESRREGRREQSLRVTFLRVSWRHKASRSSGRRHASRCVVGMEALVGSSAVQVASSTGIERAGDSGCPKACRGGERRRPTPLTRRNRTQARDTVACGSGRVLSSVLRPVLVDPHYAPTG
jgi:hypothetical protein